METDCYLKRHGVDTISTLIRQMERKLLFLDMLKSRTLFASRE